MPRLAELERLRAEIAQIEKRPALAEVASEVNPSFKPAVTDVLRAPSGLLHEIFTDELRNSGAGLGFALGIANGLLGGERQAIVYLQLIKESQEIGLPYGVGLASFGIAPERVVFGRLETTVELLWALEEAIVCRAVAAVIADVGGHPRALDFTASRRLTLRAAAAGASVFFLRYGHEREASAAQIRWRIEPRLSDELPFDPRAPGSPRFMVEIEKGRLGRTRPMDGLSLLLDWTENGFAAVEPKKLVPVSRPAALPHAFPAALGNRLSKAG